VVKVGLRLWTCSWEPWCCGTCAGSRKPPSFTPLINAGGTWRRTAHSSLALFCHPSVILGYRSSMDSVSMPAGNGLMKDRSPTAGSLAQPSSCNLPSSRNLPSSPSPFQPQLFPPSSNLILHPHLHPHQSASCSNIVQPHAPTRSPNFNLLPRLPTQPNTSSNHIFPSSLPTISSHRHFQRRLRVLKLQGLNNTTLQTKIIPST
jgi:hypothetical protein